MPIPFKNPKELSKYFFSSFYSYIFFYTYVYISNSHSLLQGATKIFPNNFVFSSFVLLFVCFVPSTNQVGYGWHFISLYSKLTLRTKSTGTTCKRTNISYLWKKSISNLKHLLQRKYKYIVEDNYSIIVDPAKANPCWFVHV